jgi:hypothetical protein
MDWMVLCPLGFVEVVMSQVVSHSHFCHTVQLIKTGKSHIKHLKQMGSPFNWGCDMMVKEFENISHSSAEKSV